MRFHLDDDSASPLLANLLRQAGHDVQLPVDVGMKGKADPLHLAFAISEDRVCLTANHRDFVNLHHLVQRAEGHHPGILVVRYDNDPLRDLTPRGIVRAIRNLQVSGVPVRDQFVILNHWR